MGKTTTAPWDYEKHSIRSRHDDELACWNIDLYLWYGRGLVTLDEMARLRAEGPHAEILPASQMHTVILETA